MTVPFESIFAFGLLAMTVGYMTKPAGAKVEDCTYTGFRINGSATLIDAGNSLRSDGLGEYIEVSAYCTTFMIPRNRSRLDSIMLVSKSTTPFNEPGRCFLLHRC